jgi:hypothetical protein
MQQARAAEPASRQYHDASGDRLPCAIANKLDARRTSILDDDAPDPGPIDQTCAIPHGVIKKIARRPLRTEQATVTATPASAAAERRTDHLVELAPLQPQLLRSLHDHPGHGADEIVRQRRRHGGREIHHRAAAGRNTLHQQRRIRIHENAFAGNGGDPRHLSQRPLERRGAALLQDEHAHTVSCSLPRDAGASGAAADDDDIEGRMRCCAHVRGCTISV